LTRPSPRRREYIANLNSLLSEEKYQYFFSSDPGHKRWRGEVLDTSDIELGIRIFGLLKINDKPFVPTSVSVYFPDRFPELPPDSPAFKFVLALAKVEERYNTWLTAYTNRLGVGMREASEPIGVSEDK
jgi:hypothetical protein